ncbi:GAP family protein [Mycolicibacterium brisbanense]
MWGQILGWALLVALNPMLLGGIVLVISRPRPEQNLFAFWVACVVVNVVALMGAVIALHSIPSFAAFAQGLSTRDPESGIQPLQLCTGVLALGIAAFLAVRSRMRPRVAATTAGRGESAVLVLESDEPHTDSRPSGPVRSMLHAVASPMVRLMKRARDEWDSGALWVSMALSLIYVLPPPFILVMSTVIVASGTPIVTQLGAVLVFVAVMFVVFEVALLSYAVVPAKTHAVLELVHGWALARRTQILIVLFGLVGIWQVLTGVGVA